MHLPTLSSPRPRVRDWAILLVLLFGLCVSASAQEMHTWTDTQGRSLRGQLLSGDDKNVDVRRDDGRTFSIALSKLSQADRDYAKAELARRQPPPDLNLSFTPVKVDSDKGPRGGDMRMIANQWAYSVTLENHDLHPINDLRIEYVTFALPDNQPGKDSSVKLERLSGKEDIPVLQGREKHNFRTQPMTLKQVKLAPNTYWAKTGTSEDLKDKLAGAWVRVYQGDKLLLEQISPTSLQSEGWDNPSN